MTQYLNKLKETEEYVILEEFPNYKIYRNGNVIGNMYFTPLKPFIRSKTSPYYALSLTNKNKHIQKIYLHNLLAYCFIPNILNVECIDHIDGNKLNNNLCNLRWCTTSQNLCNRKKIKRSTETDFKESPHKFVSWNTLEKKWVGRLQFGCKTLFNCLGDDDEKVYIKCLKKLYEIKTDFELSFYDNKVQNDLIKYKINEIFTV